MADDRSKFETDYIKVSLGAMLKDNRNADLPATMAASMREKRSGTGYSVPKYDFAWRIWKMGRRQRRG